MVALIWFYTKDIAAQNDKSLSQSEFDAIYKHYRRLLESRQYRQSSTRVYFDGSDEYTVEDSLPEMITHKVQCAKLKSHPRHESQQLLEEREHMLE